MALVTCPKCGKEKVSNMLEECPQCGFKIEGYVEPVKNTTVPTKANNSENIENKERQSYGFQYVFSFLIPLIGFILGAILLSKDNETERSVGKTCIVLGVISTIISAVIVGVIMK